MWTGHSRLPGHPPPYYQPPNPIGERYPSNPAGYRPDPNPAGFNPNPTGYPPNPNPSGSLYPNPYAVPQYPSHGGDGVPVLRHKGVPSPVAPGSTLSAPPSYGFVAPAGSVPHQQTTNGPDEWITVRHHDRFPHGAVQAMDRPLNNNDHTAKQCYVALWEHQGEAVFGRAWNNNGKVEAWFPHGGKEHHSQGQSFKLLIYRGPPSQNFRYAWVPVNQLNSLCQPVNQQIYSPIVIGNLNVESFKGELLGKGDLSKKMAWISYAGREYDFGHHAFDTCYVLCRVPL